ncbi:MAG: type II toxin-antitoxin system RelE/ParE family toxin [Nitrospinae bacterium]|nr:type II toxin-antitoxin system RelE/ParE family toxin [Nitrospinota bacterium]
MPPYELTKEATSDLEGIFRYTINQWGEKQARIYSEKLGRCFRKIAGKKVVPRTFSETFPEALVTRCEHHFIFYIQPEREENRPIIFSVLHERMDLLARLQGRLE